MDVGKGEVGSGRVEGEGGDVGEGDEEDESVSYGVEVSRI